MYRLSVLRCYGFTVLRTGPRLAEVFPEIPQSRAKPKNRNPDTRQQRQYTAVRSCFSNFPAPLGALCSVLSAKESEMAETFGSLWEYNFCRIIVVDVSDDYRLMQPPMPPDFYPVLAGDMAAAVQALEEAALREPGDGLSLRLA